MYGKHVRVKEEVENLVKAVSEKTGYQPYTIRNTAILLGLWLITMGAKIPKDDIEFLELYERVKEVVLT